MVGLFFGSFNPIHKAHVAIAQYIVDNNICDSVRFVISPCNPFKKQCDLLDERLRLQIAEVSLSYDGRFSASDIEFDMPRPSYTIDTLRRIQAQEPTTKFALIMGADNLQGFCRWKEWQTILDNFQILVYPRPGDVIDEFTHSNIRIINAPLLPISATEIRTNVTRKLSISGLVMPQAETLIKSLYTSHLDEIAPTL